MKCPNGSEAILSYGAFAQVIAINNCMCSDGKKRKIFRVGVPDTFWTMPGAVKVKGKTVTGYTTYQNDLANETTGYYFYANKFGKNGALLP